MNTDIVLIYVVSMWPLPSLQSTKRSRVGTEISGVAADVTGEPTKIVDRFSKKIFSSVPQGVDKFGKKIINNIPVCEVDEFGKNLERMIRSRLSAQILSG